MIARFEEEEEFRSSGWASNYEVRLWPKDNISRRSASSMRHHHHNHIITFHVAIIILIIIMIIIITVAISMFIRSGRGLINMSEFESSRRLEEAIHLEPGVEYSVRVVTR